MVRRFRISFDGNTETMIIVVKKCQACARLKGREGFSLNKILLVHHSKKKLDCFHAVSVFPPTSQSVSPSPSVLRRARSRSGHNVIPQYKQTHRCAWHQLLQL